MRDASRAADNVVLGIRRERGDHALNVVGGLEAEMLVDLRVHLLRRERHDVSPPVTEIL